MDGAVTADPTGRDARVAESLRMSDRAMAIGLVINILLSVVKIVVGVLAQSPALLADGLHSISDLFSDGAIWIANRMSREAADEGHPYGHGRYETMAILFSGVLLFALSVGIVIDSISRVEKQPAVVPGMEALVVIILAILAKEWLYHYTRRVGETYHLRALVANAWHHRSDSISSVAALVGIAGAMVGWPVADPIAAIVVSAILMKMAYGFMRDAFLEFTDAAAAIDKAIQEQIVTMVDEYPDVYSAHLFKVRRSGPNLHVDIHVVVNPFLSVSEGHQIAERLRRAIIDGVLEVTEVMVHVDPEEDQKFPMPIDYPGRQEMIAALSQLLEKDQGLVAVSDLVMHYTRDGIVADLVVSVDSNHNLDELRRASLRLCQKIISSQERISNVRIKTVLHGCDRGWS
ncbi:MAG: cation transporter [Magnetococcales bacterium]|nr:cation transporter [Magnetococcales bacterium]MBF0632548.1 cation transporter [Magnetococcales bacterium]